MSKSFGSIVLVLGAACLAPGCATSPTPAYAPGSSAKHAIFNPYSMTFPARDVPRANWPTTEAYRGSGEVIHYREVVIDLQGRLGNTDDYQYRRFHSVRTGRGNR